MKDIVIEVTKGMVTGLYCDIEDARFVVVDWDLVERDKSANSIGIEQHHERLRSLPRNTRTKYRQAISA
jgi:hypothetical protein